MKKEQKLREIIRKMIVDEGFAGGLKKEQRKKFDNHRRKQSEVLGYKLTGVNDVKTEIDDATIKEGKLSEGNPYGLTYKKGKTVTVTHKTSGKELVIVDKPAVRKEYEKIGFFAEGKLTEKANTLPPFEIAKRMMKSKYWQKAGKGFEKKVIRKFRGRGVSEKALDKWLPDYIDGGEISALFEGKLNDGKFSKQQMNQLKSAYGTLNKMNPSSPTYKKFIKFLEKLPKDQLKQLSAADIKFVSMLAKNRIKGESINEAKETIFHIAARVLKNKQNEKWKGVRIDLQSANLLVKVFQKVNTKTKQILIDLGNKDAKQLMNTLWAVAR